MIHQDNSFAQFAPINTFFTELPPPRGRFNLTVTGRVVVYKWHELKEDSNNPEYTSWKNKINEYVKNAAGSSCSSNNIEWLKDDINQKKVIYMITAIRLMNEDIPREIFKGWEPYRFFNESSMVQCEEDFIKTITDEVAQAWAETSNDNLWEVIDTAVKQIMGQEMYEIYAYKPQPEDDPLGRYYNALSSCYFFFYRPTNEILISMQFADVPASKVFKESGNGCKKMLRREALNPEIKVTANTILIDNNGRQQIG